jgi:hypothetical protein
LNSRQLDGGPALELTGAGGAALLARRDAAPRLYRSFLGQQTGIPGLPPLFFSFPGAFDFLIPGGSEVQRAQARFETGQPLRWTNQDQLATVNRAAGLTLNWMGGDASQDLVFAAVLSSDDAANSAGLALCVAPVDAGSFAIPPYILASLRQRPSMPSAFRRGSSWPRHGSAILPGSRCPDSTPASSYRRWPEQGR